MASKGRVTLRGRFPAGTRVDLIEVKDESVLRSQGGKNVGTKRVGDDGCVSFQASVGARYFIVGRVHGELVEVRVTGKPEGEDSSVAGQAPVQNDRVRLSDGSWADEAPGEEKAPSAAEVSTAHQRHARDRVQRSSTARGEAVPHDPSEQLPYPSQDQVKKGTVQMSDTPVGRAAPVADTPERQDQVPAGVLQRSATPVGVATVIPNKDAVEAREERDSAVAKAMRGEPGRAAAEPIDAPKSASSTSTRSEKAIPSDGDEEPPVQPSESAGSKTKAAGTSVKGADGAAGVKPVKQQSSKSTTAKKRS